VPEAHLAITVIYGNDVAIVVGVYSDVVACPDVIPCVVSVAFNVIVVLEEAAARIMEDKEDGAGGGREDVVVGCSWLVAEVSRAVSGYPFAYSDGRTGLSACD
jgi:hypothetical protein